MYLSPVSDEKEPDGGQDGEHEVGPVVLQGGAVQCRGREEVAEEDQVNYRCDDVYQDLIKWKGYHAAALNTQPTYFSFTLIVIQKVARMHMNLQKYRVAQNHGKWVLRISFPILSFLNEITSAYQQLPFSRDLHSCPSNQGKLLRSLYP